MTQPQSQRKPRSIRPAKNEGGWHKIPNALSCRLAGGCRLTATQHEIIHLVICHTLLPQEPPLQIHLSHRQIAYTLNRDHRGVGVALNDLAKRGILLVGEEVECRLNGDVKSIRLNPNMEAWAPGHTTPDLPVSKAPQGCPATPPTQGRRIPAHRGGESPLTGEENPRMVKDVKLLINSKLKDTNKLKKIRAHARARESGDRALIRTTKEALIVGAFNTWPNNPPASLFDNILAHRLKLRANNSPNAIELIGKEMTRGVAKGHRLIDMLEVWIETGWRGFRVAWYERYKDDLTRRAITNDDTIDEALRRSTATQTTH